MSKSEYIKKAVKIEPLEVSYSIYFVIYAVLPEHVKYVLMKDTLYSYGFCITNILILFFPLQQPCINVPV